MKITIGIPLFKEHDAIGNYIANTSSKLVERGHVIRIVCFQSTRESPHPEILSSKTGLIDSFVSLKLVLESIVKRKINHFLIRNKLTLLLDLLGVLLYNKGLLSVLSLLKFYQDSDIIWVHNTRIDLVSSAALLSKILFGTRFVIDYHGITPAEFFKTESDRKQSTLAESIARITLTLADAVIVHSQYMKREVEKKHGVKGLVVPLGVDIDHFTPTSFVDILEKYALHEKIVILHVGRLVPHKRVDQLIEAFSLAKNTFPNSALLIVGDGPERTNLERLTSRLNLIDSVTFVGNCSDEELPKYYSIATLLVISSLHEGFCLPIIEAMACGTPVAGSDCTAIRETLGNCGLLFDPDCVKDMASKILTLLANQKLREETIEDGLKRSKLFSWDKTVCLIDSIFMTVVLHNH